MASEKPLSSKELYLKSLIDGWHKVFYKKDVASAVEKEWNLILRLHAKAITFNEFVIERHKIFGSFE